MAKPDPDDTIYIDRAVAAWEEWKAPHFRSFMASTNDAKRLWAIVLSSDWPGSGVSRMERLLTLLPKAIEQAARMPVFGARTTLWTVCKSAAGVERLAHGTVPADYEELQEYDAQVLRVRMPEDTLILLRGEARRLGTSPSLLVARIIEEWAAD